MFLVDMCLGERGGFFNKNMAVFTSFDTMVIYPIRASDIFR